MKKYICKKIEYCPCADCDEVYVMVPDASFGRIGLDHGMKKVKGGVEYQYKKRVLNMPEDIKMELFKLLNEGKSIGECKGITNTGGGVVGEILLSNIHKREIYSFHNPYTKKVEYDSMDL